MKIYKYQLKLERDEFGKEVISMPNGAKIIHIGTQLDKICIWAEVTPDNPVEDRTFHVVGTGHDLPESFAYTATHLGTVHLPPFVWHIYEMR